MSQADPLAQFRALNFLRAHEPTRPSRFAAIDDRLMLYLLLDQSLRVGEVAGLQATDLDLATGELRFCRPKPDKVQAYRVTRAALAAARAHHSAPLGEVDGSPTVHWAQWECWSTHDLRPTWATRARRNGTPIDWLQDAGDAIDSCRERTRRGGAHRVQRRHTVWHAAIKK